MPSPPHYPFETPEFGETLEVAPGIHWLRMPLPFALNHVNLWLVAEADGWTVIDTGYNDDASRAAWDAVLDGLMAGGAVRRLVITHFHPDHIGLAGRFAERFGVEMWITYGEYAAAHLAWDHAASSDQDLWTEFIVANGIARETAEGMREGRARFRRTVMPVPVPMRRLWDGEVIALGGRNFRVITGAGHSPEHAAFFCPEINLLISGDQVLPRITTNVGVWYTEPYGNPLLQYLDSLEKFRSVREDALVLPSHNRPFTGLHDRLDGLIAHHDERLALVAGACDEPKLAAELLPVMFKRTLDRGSIGLALGEALAHLNYLVHDGRLVRETDAAGLVRFRRDPSVPLAAQ